MNNTSGDRVDKTMDFKAALERRTGLEVVMWDERLTTVAADNAMMEAGIRRENRKEYVDMIVAGIIDPTKVTRSALQNAASVASMVLTTESLVADKKEENPAPAAAPGMGAGMM